MHRSLRSVLALSCIAALLGSAACSSNGRTMRGTASYRGLPSAPPGSACLNCRATPDTESYGRTYESGFHAVEAAPVSTFGIDVDTAAYANVRRFVEMGQLPPPDAVRIEELLNYFHYALPEPEGEEPVAALAEVGPCPWQPEHRLVRIALRGRSLVRGALPPRSLTFLIDVSGSMQDARKLPLLQRSLGVLVEQLRAEDRVALVVYAGREGVVLEPTSGGNRREIREAVARLQAGGPTNGGAGIALAYQVARDAFIPGGVNRVILATDGDFNVGVSSPGELVRMVEAQRESGIELTVLGFGMGNLKDSTLERLADRGNGNYAYIDSFAEARKVLGEQAAGTLVTVARDVKVQVEFNPLEVASYRLLGYENRALAREDFEGDRADAGELGAGQGVTVLYELELADGGGETRGTSPLRYQADLPLREPALSGELLWLKIRYQPAAFAALDDVRELSRAVRDSGHSLSATSADFQFASAVAVFGLALRDSPDRGSATAGLARELAARALRIWPRDAQRREFLALVKRAEGIGQQAAVRGWRRAVQEP